MNCTMFAMEIDIENLMIIMRLKKYFNASNEYISNLLLPFYFKVKKDEILGYANNHPDIYERLNKAPNELFLNN